MPSESDMPLRHLLIATKDGDWGKGEPIQGHVPYRVIRGADFPGVRTGDASKVPLRYLSERTVFRRTLEANDILIETAGGTKDRPTGRTLLITQRLLDGFEYPVTCASFARFLRVDPAQADPRYVYWYLQGLYAAGEMAQHQVQHTGVARFQFTQFAETQRVPLPSRSQQQAIAELLGTLDDKIECNEQTVSRLLGWTSAMFESFSSDVQETTTVGAIIRRLSAPTAGQVPCRDGDDLVPLLHQGDGPVLYEARAATWTASADEPKIVFGDHTCRMHLAVSNFNIGKNVVVFLGERRPTLWTYYALKTKQTFQEYKRHWADLVVKEVGLPPRDRCVAFERIARPIHEYQRALNIESIRLRALRDALLPALLSGELSVRDAEMLTSEAM